MPRLRIVPNIAPNKAIIGPTLNTPVKPLITNKGWGAKKVAPHEIALAFDFDGTVAVIVHFDRQGRIDGVSSNYRRLRVYGKPLAIGFRRIAGPLKRHGWREGTCTRRHGHFAALGTPEQPHTFIVWTGPHVTVAMSTAHSTFARTKADCLGISDASATATR